MSNLSKLDVQNLRHLLVFGESDKQKYQTYAEQCTDPNIKQFFQKEAQSADQSRQKLIQFLN